MQSKQSNTWKNLFAPDATAEEKVEARDKSMAIMTLTQSEETLESLVKAKGYDNVLVVA